MPPNYCVMCGMTIPDGQTTCSMCYGDIDHGRDGYYRERMEREAENEYYRRQDECPEDERKDE